MNKRKAFTLVELLVVIAIICILAAVMIPVLTGVLDKSKDQTDEVSAGLYTSVMQQFANEKAGDALLYPGLTTTGTDAEYTVLSEKSGHGMYPGYNILVGDNDDDVYDAIRREAVIAIKAYSDVKTLDGYYVEPPSKEHYQYVYYYLTGRVTMEDERNKTPVSKSSIENGVVNIEDYWVYLSRDGGSGDAIVNSDNGTGMVFIQVRQYGTDSLLEDVTVTLRIGAGSMTAVTGKNGTVGFSGISIGSVFAEAEKLGAVSFPDSRFYTEDGHINVKNGGYVGDTAANPYVITLKMGSLGSLGFYRRTNTWNGSAWDITDAYITDNVTLTSAFTVDTSRPNIAARNETYYTNTRTTSGRQELLTEDGKFLLYGPYNLTVSGTGYRNYTEAVVSRVYGIDNYKNGGVGEYASATAPYEYPIIMRRPLGTGEVSGVITWERMQQPLKGTPSAAGTWVTGHENYDVNTRVVMKNKTTGTCYYSSYFAASSTGKYPYKITGLPDGSYSIYLDTPYGTLNTLDLSGLPDTVTIDGSEVIINAQVFYADVDMGKANITVTYDGKGNYDPISGASVSLTRLGSVRYSARKTDDNGKCTFGSIKRGFYQISITPPTYIGSDTYTYRMFVDGDEDVTIRLPIDTITITGTVSGFKPDGNPMTLSGSFDGLKVTFTRYNESGSKSYSAVAASVTTTGVKATYTVKIVPGMYKIKTETTCYKDYSGAGTLKNFKECKSFDLSLTIDGSNIKCHPGARVAWKQNATYHWQECSKCGTQFNVAKHIYSAWTASGASGCYRYCTEVNCKRTLDPVTAHDYRYKAEGSYASTCVQNGNNHYECYRCKYGKNETIAKSGHNFGTWTADNADTHTRKCRNSGCNASECKAHNFGDWYWVSHDIQMSPDGSYCYSNGTQRADCTTCGYYKLSYPKVGHSIECFVMRQYVSDTLYYNYPTNYNSAFLVANTGRVYMLLGNSSEYSGRQVWTPNNPQNGGYGFKTVYTSRTPSTYGKSSIFSNTKYSHYTTCANKPVINGVTYYCYTPINHEGNPYRTSYQCGCANKPLGYIRTQAGAEILPKTNPAWEDPYVKNGRR